MDRALSQCSGRHGFDSHQGLGLFSLSHTCDMLAEYYLFHFSNFSVYLHDDIVADHVKTPQGSTVDCPDYYW